MHKFIFPTKDSWIYDLSSSVNYGGDEILELRKDFNSTATESAVQGVSRALIQFDISDVSKSIASGDITNPKFYLKLWNTEASELSKEYTLTAAPLSASWEEGTGKWQEDPVKQDGVTWDYRNQAVTSTAWSLSTTPFLSNATSGARVLSSGSNNGTGSDGGGVWYTGSLSYSVAGSTSRYVSPFYATQSFSYESPDISMDVTNIVTKWISGSTYSNTPSGYPYGIPNNGFILKISGSDTANLGLENNDVDRFNLKFFSRNTHTIYCPKLEVRYDDHIPATGSITGSYNELSMSGEVDNYIYVKGIRPEYRETETVKFKVGGRPRYIQKSFSTSVQEFTGSYFTTGSYSIVDLATNETVVPFGDHSKISGDSSGMYFNQDLNGFYPNRIYKILLKVDYEDGQKIIYDDDDFQFKVVR